MEKVLDWIKQLPNVSVCDSTKLPSRQGGLYFVLSPSKGVLYVGITAVSYRDRWKNHHRRLDILEKDENSVIHYWAQKDLGPKLQELENLFIQALQPTLNKVAGGTNLPVGRPPSNTVKKSITVPSTIWERIEKLADAPPAELCSALVEKGLLVYETERAKAMELELNEMERENKKLVNQKLKQRQGSMADALETISQALKSLPISEEVEQAVKIIEKGLSD